MARQASQAKGGFFPVSLPALDAVLSRITIPADSLGKYYFCDPCMGQAEALAHIAAHYSANPKRVFGCELESSRMLDAQRRLPDCHLVGPANYLACEISPASFSMIWLNPPFDDEIGGGGRVEHDFLRHATRTLVTGGIMAFCCPEDTAKRYDTVRHFLTFYDNVSMIPFQPEHRKFREVVVIGQKVDEFASKSRYVGYDCKYSYEPLTYILPTGYYPFKFTKTELAEDELLAALALSPLNRLIESRPVRDLPSPPLALGKGHIALLLASGHLDGVVSPPDEPPHLVRGTARKIEYVKSIESEVDEEKGTDKTVVVKSERIVLTIRTLDGLGVIRTFADKPIDAVKQQSDTEQPCEDEQVKCSTRRRRR